MEHPYEKTVAKLRFNKSFQKNTPLLKLMKSDMLAKTDSIIPFFLHGGENYLWKFRFLSVTKACNFY